MKANTNPKQTTKGKTTMKTTNKTTKTTETNNTFKDLLTAYGSNPNDGETLYALATAVAYSVLKKCIDVSQNKALIQVRQSIAKDTHTLKQIEYANANAYETTYNADGERVQRVKDKDSIQALNTLCAECLGDGLDLVNDAVIAILDETRQQSEREPLEPVNLERPYTVRRLKKKVWIKTADSVDGWETVETAPIQEIYKAVRRSIDSSRAVQTDPRNGYTYIEDLSKDPETDSDTVIYRRFGKYADIGGAVVDFNRKEIAYTADMQTAKDLDALVEMLNLTPRQAKVLALRQSGYGYGAIATYLGIQKPNAVRVCKQIQSKIKTNNPDLYTLAVKLGYIKE